MGRGVGDGGRLRLRRHPQRAGGQLRVRRLGVPRLELGGVFLNRGRAFAGNAPPLKPDRLAAPRQWGRHRDFGIVGIVCRLRHPGSPRRSARRLLGRAAQPACVAAVIRRDHSDRLGLPRRPSASPRWRPYAIAGAVSYAILVVLSSTRQRTLRRALCRPTRARSRNCRSRWSPSPSPSLASPRSPVFWWGAGDAVPTEALGRDRKTAVQVARLRRITDPRGGCDLPGRERDHTATRARRQSRPCLWR